MKPNLKDKNGDTINSGDIVSLAGNITADNSLGFLPNGWTFDEHDKYEVFYDDKIDNWSLKLGVEPNSAYNCKYMNHAVGIMHSGDCEIINHGS